MNRRTPLEIYAPYGEAVHPDVLYVPGGFSGWDYWLAFTPYPRGSDLVENPVIRVSKDGVHWDRMEGVSDPLIGSPEDGDCHNADPELVFVDGSLYLIYMTAHRKTGKIWLSYICTEDGKHWTPPEIFRSGQWEVSPSVLYKNGKWQLWAIRLDTRFKKNRSTIFRLEGSGINYLTCEKECECSIPGYVPWHLDLQFTAEGMEALVAAFPVGTDNSRTKLFRMLSQDGLKFRLTNSKPLLRPRIFGWDNRQIYRSTFIREGDRCQVWYSASSWGFRWHIGYFELHQDGHIVWPQIPSQELPSRIVRIKEDVIGWLHYQLRRHSPKKLIQLIRLIRVWWHGN